MKLSLRLVAVAQAFVLAGSGVALAGSAAAAPARPTAAPAARSALDVVNAAARAMGGIEKLRAIRNITAHGYGQYAYMLGGGRITGLPGAPEKYIAANDLTRVYDLENGRFQARERRVMLFPFLAPGGHNYPVTDNRLDGDIAYDISTGGAFGGNEPPHPVRQPRWSESPLVIDGVHMRRMWMMNNPAVLLRAMLDPATKLSAPRRVGGDTEIDVTLKEGDKLTAGFAASGMPAWVRWSNPQTNLGQANLTTYFEGWGASDGQGGILLPYAYQTRLDWRNIDFLKIYVDAYDLNTDTPDLAAPASVRAEPEPVSFPVPKLTATPVGKGVWRISNGTTVIEFKDHLVLFELAGNARGGAKAVLDLARSLAPGKPVRYLIISHHHFDHTSGLREAVAEGVTVIQRPNSFVQFREVVGHPAPDFPDDLAKTKAPFKTLAVDEHLRLQDETQTVDVYWGRKNAHMSDVLVAYVPSEKMLIEGDVVSAAYEWQHWPDTFRDVVAYYKLDVDKVSPAHTVLPNHPGTLSLQEVEDLMKGGAARARQHCADEAAKGNYHPGCPIQSKYY
jgi:glyoxylase-like metal-dependent hydrolase (beta-lactamase superfamily II)